MPTEIQKTCCLRGNPAATALSVASLSSYGLACTWRAGRGCSCSHSLKKDGRTRRGGVAAGERSDLRLQFLHWAHGGLNLPDSSKSLGKNQIKLLPRDWLRRPVLRGEGGRHWAWGVEGKKKEGACGWVCARGSAPRSAPHTPAPGLGPLRKGGSGSRGNQREQDKPSQSDALNTPDFEFEAKGC